MHAQPIDPITIQRFMDVMDDLYNERLLYAPLCPSALH